MDKLLITGGSSLKGTIQVSGSKNGTLPLMSAAILSHKKVTLRNVPDLTDVRHMGDALTYAGMETEFTDEKITVTTADPSKVDIPYEVSQMMRASIAFLGPLLAKRGKADVALPGGCIIGTRPVDLHLKGLSALGADISITRGTISAKADNLKGAHVYLGGNYGSSVLATANVMMAASRAEGRTVIEHAACEPEIVELSLFLKELGVNIEGAGSHCLIIEGVREYEEKEIEFTVIPDRIEAGTYMCAAAITNSEVTINKIRPDHLEAVTSKLEQMGFGIEVHENSLTVKPAKKIKAVDIITQEYPAFPTDMQAQFLALCTQANGVSMIEERLFENRFMHVSELQRLGADIKLKGNSATVLGKMDLVGADVMATDLRASSALVLAAMVAEGTTDVHRIYHLDRGYVELEKKLQKLGAKIKRLKE